MHEKNSLKRMPLDQWSLYDSVAFRIYRTPLALIEIFAYFEATLSFRVYTADVQDSTLNNLDWGWE